MPVVANVLAGDSRSADPTRDRASRLVEQVTGTVRWRECVAFMAERRASRTFYEIGAGKVLSGLVKRIADGADRLGAIGTPDDIAAFKAARAQLAFEVKWRD